MNNLDKINNNQITLLQGIIVVQYTNKNQPITIQLLEIINS